MNHTDAIHTFDITGPTPCRNQTGTRDAWFSPFRDKRNAVLACRQHCPFLGRCAYNAVAVGATHGVWGGMSLSGSLSPAVLTETYTQLLAQYRRRARIELGRTAVPPPPPIPRDEGRLQRGHEPAVA